MNLPTLPFPVFKKILPAANASPQANPSSPTPPPAASTPPAAKDLASAKSVKDIIAPNHISVDFNTLLIGDHFFRTLYVGGYPRFVVANWLSPLINFDHSLTISMFIYPVESKSTLDDLRRKIAEMEAEISTDMQRGRVVDPSTQAKLEDALALQDQLVKGIERFFQFALYVTIPAESQSELETTDKQVKSLLASLLISTTPALLEQGQGFQTTTPVCVDHLGVWRNMDTTSLATTFPFTSSELTSNEGILYGLNEHNGSLVLFDRFSLENANSVVFAKAGSGKSIWGYDKVLFDDGAGPKISQVGPLVENLISQHGAQKIDDEMEGVLLPHLKVWTFNNKLEGQWANVTVAARKKFSPRNRLYTITTKSGRRITVTADHNMVILRNGKIRVMRSEAIKTGERVPLPRHLSITSTQTAPKDLLFLLGLITSEGHANQETVEIYNTDPLILDIIRSSATTLGYQVSPRYNYPQRSIRGYHIRPASFARLCYSLGVCGKSGEKRVPPIVFSLSNEQAAHYLRAYYEGDGGVEGSQVTATTKSKNLASDLAYLLLRFGIIGRIRPKIKTATNARNRASNTYYQVTISGKNQLQKYADHIGFLTPDKNQKLAALLGKLSIDNTNVDTIPTLESTFKYLYKTLYPTSEIKAPQVIIDLKNGEYHPSPSQLSEAISLCQARIQELRSLNQYIQVLRDLPSVSRLINIGRKSRRLNRLLWAQLGQSWRIMKNYIHPPLTRNVLLAHQTISGKNLALPDVSSALYTAFKQQGVSLQEYDRSLWTSVVDRQSGNSRYNTIFKAAKYIARKYRSTQSKIHQVQQKLSSLKLLANSDLFWDPVASIERIKHKERYVYDLQVDNGVFLAGEGGMFVHNSYAVKLEILRSLMFGTEIIVIDPENEYRALCNAVGGEYINFSFASQNRINPFDMSALTETSEENELNLKVQSLHSLFKVIMGVLNPTEDAILDRALQATYKMKGITPDPETQKKTPPLMEDLFKALIGMEDPLSRSMADRIEKFVKGSFAGIIDQPSNVTLKNPFTIFSVRDLEDSLKPIAIFIILDYIWTKMRRDLKRRLLVVDEAWYLMRNPDSAAFLYGIAKRCRKYFMGLTTITQDVEDFLGSDYGRPIVTNSSIQILMKQSPAAIDKVQQVFYLSEGEKHLLMSAAIGEGLFFAGNNHVAVRFVSSPDEHKLITTRPQDILKQQQETAAAPDQKPRLITEIERPK